MNIIRIVLELVKKRTATQFIIVVIITVFLLTNCGISQVQKSDDIAISNNHIPDDIDDLVEDFQPIPQEDIDTESEQIETWPIDAIAYDEWQMSFFGRNEKTIFSFKEWQESFGGITAGNLFVLGEWRDEPIEWRVLDVQDDKALVISNKILALRQYNDFADPSTYDYGEENHSTWADCSLRTWLNNDFYQTAFSEEEQKEIILSLIKTPDYDTEYKTYYGDGTVEKTPVCIPGTKDTKDLVFCLSVEEAEKYLPWDVIKIAAMTVTEQDYEYAVEAVNGIGFNAEGWWYIWGGYTLNETSPKMWWLRSGTYVSPFGGIWIGSTSGDGDIPRGWPCGVRPAMWVQLRSV